MNEQQDHVIFKTERFSVREWRVSDVDAVVAIDRSDKVQELFAFGRGQ